jgi:hypothetical protein
MSRREDSDNTSEQAAVSPSSLSPCSCDGKQMYKNMKWGSDGGKDDDVVPLGSGLWRRVDSSVDTDVFGKHLRVQPLCSSETLFISLKALLNGTSTTLFCYNLLLLSLFMISMSCLLLTAHIIFFYVKIIKWSLFPRPADTILTAERALLVAFCTLSCGLVNFISLRAV